MRLCCLDVRTTSMESPHCVSIARCDNQCYEMKSKRKFGNIRITYKFVVELFQNVPSLQIFINIQRNPF